VDLGLFDFLVEPKSAVETAAWLKADPRATGIFLNGLRGWDSWKSTGTSSVTASWQPATWYGARKTTGGHRQAHRAHLGTGLGRPEGNGPGGPPPGGGNREVVDGRPERDKEEVRAFIWGMHAIARDLAPLVAAKLDLKAVRHSWTWGAARHLCHHLCPGQPGAQSHGLRPAHAH